MFSLAALAVNSMLLMSQPDAYPYAGLPPQKSAEVMTVPPGFSVKLFAGEPDVHQPIAFCIDDRGRLWVAEAYSYPVRRPDKEAKDRIIIFEDTDGDGVFDKQTVFMEGLNLVSGIEVGFGGVWIGAAPYLMFVPIKAGEDKPAGPPQILLDGWGYQDTHETLNTFTWGPDGWLYGCHGVFTHSKVGKPGTPNKDRVPINAGVWRYHPTRHIFEVFAHGTSNPWGLDFDKHGQAFVEACVIPHNWHIIQGARYQRQAGSHFNQYTYADIPTIAEHRHFIGETPHSGNGRSDSAGGGHAHSGAMIYQGAAWPKEFSGQMFMGNIHGHRLNVDKLTPKGSGFVASRAPDFLLANDSWALFVNLQSGPDGNVYLIDWYDKQPCHTNNPEIWDRTNGRIYKICHKDTKPVVGFDLAKESDIELCHRLEADNVWFARHAQRLLQERNARGELGKQTPGGVNAIYALLKNIAFPPKADAPWSLRALWALHAVGALDPMYVQIGLSSTDPYFRAWSIQLAIADGRLDDSIMETMAAIAHDDPSPVVRLYLASGLQRLPPDKRWKILKNLVAHAEDADDHNLPLMYWYAAEPLAEKEPARALDLALAAKVPPSPRFMARRVSSAATPDALALVVDRLAKAKDESLQLAILGGIRDGLGARRNTTAPPNWATTLAALGKSEHPDVRIMASTVAVSFGDANAVAELRNILANTENDLAQRQYALAALLGARDTQLPPQLQKLLSEPPMRGASLRALAAFDDPKTPEAVLAVYTALSGAEKRDAMNTLASRASYGKALMDAVAAKKIAANEISADLVRQLRNLKDNALDQRITEVWGIFRATPADRARAIAEWRKFLTVPAKTDLSLGRAVFAKTCQQCHTLFGVGGQVGPDLTGGNRANLDYLLENILDPSAVIPKEYATAVLELKNGRVVTGIVRSETTAALTVQTINETLTIPRGDIDTAKSSSISMMPEDLLKPLTKDEVRALVGYLQSPVQAPLPTTPKVEKDIPYADGGDDQKLDLFIPNKKDFTTIVFTFGGGWHTGSRKAVTAIGEKLQRLGFGCALLSHRLSPKDKFPAQIEDVAAGFAWVKKNIAAKGGNPGRIFVMGHSSGAQLSLLLAADPKYLAKHQLSSADIAGAIGLSTPVDLEPSKGGKGFGDALLAGRGADVFSRDAGLMKDASPIQHITKRLPPVLLVVGERDFPMLEGDAKAFVGKANAAKATAALFVAKDRDHMGVVQSLLEDNSPVMEQVLAFVSKQSK